MFCSKEKWIDRRIVHTNYFSPPFCLLPLLSFSRFPTPKTQTQTRKKKIQRNFLLARLADNMKLLLLTGLVQGYPTISPTPFF